MGVIAGEVEPLISFTIETKVEDQWGVVMVEQLITSIDASVPDEQQDAFWVKVSLTKKVGVVNVLLTNEERFIDRVNKALGQELLAWRVEAIYPEDSDQGGLAGVLLLMNTVSLQDIMALGA